MATLPGAVTGNNAGNARSNGGSATASGRDIIRNGKKSGRKNTRIGKKGKENAYLKRSLKNFS